MKRADVKELHYITPINNLRSIFQYGILCHHKAEKVLHQSIADPVIQNRREKIVIPGGKRKLHDYVNLYFNARNPMMFKRKDMHEELVILQINPAILDESEVVISDGNASSGYVKFYASPEGLGHLDKSLIYANNWTNRDVFQYWASKRAICAEVLVLHSVAARLIKGIYVSCRETQSKIKDLSARIRFQDKIIVNPTLFFQEA